MSAASAVTTSESGLDHVWNDIRAHGLQPYIADLDAHGYTVIPPEIATPNGLAERMLDACLDIAEQRNAERPDLETGSTHANLAITTTASPVTKGKRPQGRLPALTDDADSPVGDVMSNIFFEDAVFEESLMNPVLLAMASYLVGFSAVVSTLTCWMKGPNQSTFRLHTDTPLATPLPPQALVCQLSYVLTDFNRENGATAFVPGSHRWCRQPVGRETIIGEGGNQQTIPVEAKAGSLVIWHGNTWHGAFNRTAPGLRVSVPHYLVRPFIRTRENFIDKIPQEMLNRHPPRFAILTQQGIDAGHHDRENARAITARARKYQAAYAQEFGGELPLKDLYT